MFAEAIQVMGRVVPVFTHGGTYRCANGARHRDEHLADLMFVDQLPQHGLWLRNVLDDVECAQVVRWRNGILKARKEGCARFVNLCLGGEDGVLVEVNALICDRLGEQCFAEIALAAAKFKHAAAVRDGLSDQIELPAVPVPFDQVVLFCRTRGQAACDFGAAVTAAPVLFVGASEELAGGADRAGCGHGAACSVLAFQDHAQFFEGASGAAVFLKRHCPVCGQVETTAELIGDQFDFASSRAFK